MLVAGALGAVTPADSGAEGVETKGSRVKHRPAAGAPPVPGGKPKMEVLDSQAGRTWIDPGLPPGTPGHPHSLICLDDGTFAWLQGDNRGFHTLSPRGDYGYHPVGKPLLGLYRDPRTRNVGVLMDHADFRGELPVSLLPGDEEGVDVLFPSGAFHVAPAGEGGVAVERLFELKGKGEAARASAWCRAGSCYYVAGPAMEGFQVFDTKEEGGRFVPLPRDLAGDYRIQGITRGWDHRIWFTLASPRGAGTLAGFDPAQQALDVFHQLHNPGHRWDVKPGTVILGSDRNLWFTVQGRSWIGSASQDGRIQFHETVRGDFRESADPLGGIHPGNLVPAPDGTIYFTAEDEPGIFGLSSSAEARKAGAEPVPPPGAPESKAAAPGDSAGKVKGAGKKAAARILVGLATPAEELDRSKENPPDPALTLGSLQGWLRRRGISLDDQAFQHILKDHALAPEALAARQERSRQGSQNGEVDGQLAPRFRSRAALARLVANGFLKAAQFAKQRAYNVVNQKMRCQTVFEEEDAGSYFLGGEARRADRVMLVTELVDAKLPSGLAVRMHRVVTVFPVGPDYNWALD